jgi:hypothetical protein
MFGRHANELINVFLGPHVSLLNVTVPTMAPGAGPLTSMTFTWALPLEAMGKLAGNVAIRVQGPEEVGGMFWGGGGC